MHFFFSDFAPASRVHYNIAMQGQWQKIREKLRGTVDSGTFNVWLAQLKGKVNESTLSLYAPSIFIADMVKSRFFLELKTAMTAVLDVPASDIVISISVAAEKPRNDETVPATVTRTIQNVLPLRVASNPATKTHWRYSFDDFVEGDSNRMAVAAAKDICNTDGQIQTCFVNSSSGLGKTHLSHALGRLASQVKDGQRVNYLTADDFASKYVASWHNKDLEGFKQHLKHSDVLVLEDVHLFRDKFKMQEMALNIVKDIQSKGGKIVFTSIFSPCELQKVDAQLVSCFCSGIVTSIGRPTKEMRCEILSRKAKKLKANLPASVKMLLASRLNGDVRQLESCLESLVYKANLLKQGITEDLALGVLSQYAAAEECLDLEGLTSLVCNCYGIDSKAVVGPSRSQLNVMARNTIYYLARRHTDLALETIGHRFNRSHSTVLKGIATVQNALDKQSRIGRQISSAISLVERQAGLAGRA